MSVTAILLLLWVVLGLYMFYIIYHQRSTIAYLKAYEERTWQAYMKELYRHEREQLAKQDTIDSGKE